MTLHCSCVQTAVMALNEFSAMRATRNLPAPLSTNAALPEAESGDPAPIGTVTVLPDTLALMTLRVVLPPPGVGDGFVGLLLPPHPSASEATVTIDIA